MNAQSDYLHGDQVIYQCDDGYTMTGPEVRTCVKHRESTGKWTGFNPFCSGNFFPYSVTIPYLFHMLKSKGISKCLISLFIVDGSAVYYCQVVQLVCLFVFVCLCVRTILSPR